MTYLSERLTLRHYMVGLGVVVGAVVLLFALGVGAKAAYHEITKERPHFNTGVVINKDFDPAHYDDYATQQYTGESCYGTGTSRTCTSNYITIWHHDYVPDNWSVQIKNCNVMHKNGTLWVDKHGAAKCFKKWIDVDNSFYKSLRIGSHYA